MNATPDILTPFGSESKGEKEKMREYFGNSFQTFNHLNI